MKTALTPRPPSPRLRTGKGEQYGIPLILFAAFLALTFLVARGAMDRFDDGLLRWVQARLLPHLGWLWEAISWPGYAPQSYGVAALFVVIAWGYRGQRGLVLMLLAVLSSPIGSLIKYLIARPRPTPEQAQVVGGLIPSSSYPSGHVLTYTVMCGVLFLLVRDVLPTEGWERRRDGVMCGILLALVILVGPSRVALGHHWPTDTFGAYLLGGALLTVLARWHRASPSPPTASEAAECS